MKILGIIVVIAIINLLAAGASYVFGYSHMEALVHMLVGWVAVDFINKS